MSWQANNSMSLGSQVNKDAGKTVGAYLSNSTVYCPHCHRAVEDVDHFLGLCDHCLGFDKLPKLKIKQNK